MLSPAAMADAARAAGWYEYVGVDGPKWFFSGPHGYQLDDPLVAPAVASHLRSQVTGSAQPHAHRRYYEMAYRLGPHQVWIGAVFQGDDASICCSMYALGKWTEEYTRLVFRGG